MSFTSKFTLVATTIFVAYLGSGQVKGQSLGRFEKKLKTELNMISDSIEVRALRRKYVSDLYSSAKDSGLVKNYIFNEILDGIQQGISGTFLKDGKAVATTASIDDKSVTVNYVIPNRAPGKVSIQLTATGASEESFVDIFSGGNYKRTLSSGFNLNFKPRFSTGNFFTTSKNKLYNSLLLADNKLNEAAKKDESAERSKFRRFKELHAKIGGALLSKNDVRSKLEKMSEDANSYNELKQRYIAYLPESLSQADSATTEKYIQDLFEREEAIISDVFNRQALKMLDSLQLNASWTKFRTFWVTLAGKYNDKKYPLFDATAADDLFTKKYHDGYLSVSVSANFLKSVKNGRSNMWVSPTLKLDNARDFDEDDLTKYQKVEPFSTQPSLMIVEETEFYPGKASRALGVDFELPVMLYWPKSKVGLEFAPAVELQPKWNNPSLKIGFFFPVAIDDEETLTLEPLIRIKKQDVHDPSFAKQYLSFGFNLSVSIPKFMGSAAK